MDDGCMEERQTDVVADGWIATDLAQNGPRSAQVGHKLAQIGPRWAKLAPSLAPSWPKLVRS